MGSRSTLRQTHQPQKAANDTLSYFDKEGPPIDPHAKSLDQLFCRHLNFCYPSSMVSHVSRSQSWGWFTSL